MYLIITMFLVWIDYIWMGKNDIHSPHTDVHTGRQALSMISRYHPDVPQDAGREEDEVGI